MEENVAISEVLPRERSFRGGSRDWRILAQGAERSNLKLADAARAAARCLNDQFTLRVWEFVNKHDRWPTDEEKLWLLGSS